MSDKQIKLSNDPDWLKALAANEDYGCVSARGDRTMKPTTAQLLADPELLRAAIGEVLEPKPGKEQE